MSQFGRDGQAIASRLGRRSVILALIAFAAGGLSITAFGASSGTAEPYPTIAMALFIGVFLFAAPLLHIVGLVCGIIAFGRSNDSRRLALIGLLLNGLSVGLGVLILWAMLSTMGAYT